MQNILDFYANGTVEHEKNTKPKNNGILEKILNLGSKILSPFHIKLGITK